MANLEDNLLSHALYVNRVNGQHANHGYFWEKGKTFGKFFAEAWVSPQTGAEYIISAGYGGSHEILWGFAGLAGGHGSITGNVYIDGGTVSFGSQDSVYEGDWHHVALGWDGQYIYTWIDGVLSKRTAAMGRRASSAGTGDGLLFIGGSDHSTYKGFIRNVRIIEGYCPQGAGHYRPEFNYKGSYNLVGNRSIPVSFIADYSTPQSIIADLGSGMSNGTRQKISHVISGSVSGAGNRKSVVTAAGMPNSPKTVTYAVSNAWTAAQVAAAERLALLQDADVGTLFIVHGTGANVIMEAVEEQANDSTMNFTSENVTSAGPADSLTATTDAKGYAGSLVKHPGFLAGFTDGSDLGNFDNGHAAAARFGPAVPKIVPVKFEQPTVFRGTQAAIPSGATFFDDFSRVNVTKLWDETLNIGTLRTGQNWISTDVGIIDGKAFFNSSGGTFKAATTNFGSVAQDVRVKRAAGSDGLLYVIVRYTDSSNYVYAVASGGQFIDLHQVSGGVDTQLTGGVGIGTDIGTSWNTIRVTAVGSLVTAYIDGSGTEVAHGTTTVLTGNEVGMGSTSAYTRIEQFRAQ